MNRKTRSILALVLALAMLAAILPAGFAATAYYGDVNGDGRVNSTDARLALRAAAKLDALKEEEFKRADVNGDGLVNSTDARSVLRMAAKLEALILMPQETAAEPPTLSETAPALPETAPAQQTSQKAEIPAEQTTLPDTPSVNAPTVPEEPATAAPEQPAKAKSSASDRASLMFPTTAAMPDDVVWKRDIYRQLDLTKDKNAPMYYPVEPTRS